MPRKANVITACFNDEFLRGTNLENNFKKTESLLSTFEGMKPDLICLPEVFLETGLGAGPVSASVSDRVIELLSSHAKKLNSYIVAGGHEHIDSELYNVAWVIDRAGNMLGRYAKVHPTMGEVDNIGVRPGREALVFDTDFGRIGVAICYDVGWPALWQDLSDKGAELVVWPSAYDGGFPLQAYAWSHFYYVVTSVRTNHSKIIDKTGQILASSSRWLGWTSHVVDLEKEVFHIDLQYQKLVEVQRRLGTKVTIKALSEENIFTLESNDSEWPVAKIKHEFGLESFRDYHKRAEEVQNRAR